MSSAGNLASTGLKGGHHSRGSRKHPGCPGPLPPLAHHERHESGGHVAEPAERPSLERRAQPEALVRA